MHTDLLSKRHISWEWCINSHADVLRLGLKLAIGILPNCEIPTGEPMVVIIETTFPFRTEIPIGEVERTSEGEVSQPGELWIMKLRNCREVSKL